MELMTLKKAAEYLGIDYTTLYRWGKDQEGPKPLVIRGRKWYTREILDNWLRSGVQSGK
jgi:excisionase family DNA binding protein